MWTTKGLLILLNLLAVINKVATAGEPKLAFPHAVTQEDIDSLLPITSKQALPVILFETKSKTKLGNAVALAVAEITDGRLTSGTKFYTRHPSDQIFFCPNPNKDDNCLEPKTFEKSEILECEYEPTPIFQPNPNRIPCGPTGAGLDLIFGYPICPASQSYSYEIKTLVIYSICYDEISKKILFTDHMITSAGLLSEQLLMREREIEYEERKEIYDYIKEEYFEELYEISQSKQQYKIQRLVSTDDMALATARKLTENYANYELQHGELIELWNEIRYYIRAHAIKSFDEPLIMMTGVFDIPQNLLSTSIEEDEMANIWVLLIIDLTINSSKGMAILMNNFINPKTDYPYIDTLCGKDFCVGSLKQKFKDVGGQVRCCRVTENISKLFMDKKDILPINKLLKIQNITYTDDTLNKFLNLFQF